jgi:hypothetical protein
VSLIAVLARAAPSRGWEGIMAKLDQDDIGVNESTNETFEQIVEARLSRRTFVGAGIGSLALALGGVGTLLDALPAAAAPQGGPKKGAKALLGFTGVPVSSADTVVVPEGYTARVLIAWGDPVSDGPAFLPDASNSAGDQAQQWGMNNDGIVYFPIKDSRHGLLVQNHEYTDEGLLFKDGVAGWNAEKTSKSMNAHGVSIIEVEKVEGDKLRKDGQWQIVRPSAYARRITGQTPMKIGGPAAGDPRLRTDDDPTGTWVLGTLNNCAMGFTPWGTYLTCEENFNGYFFTSNLDGRNNLQKRYNVGSPYGSGFRWYTTHDRFNMDKHPNEANRFGWVVEIDPFNPDAVPVKRTSLGRMKHEGAWVQEAKGGRLVVYMGDDERNEYIYRWVSRQNWHASIAKGIDPLDDGTLYAAKFKADGTGEWLPLTPDNPEIAKRGMDLNDILINTRAAADAAGATMMDRPEWIDTFPKSLTAIATLTNNSKRGAQPPSSNNPDGSTTADTANPPTDAANPRANNTYGHVIFWKYAHDWTDDTFYWEVFALCGDPAVPAHGSTIQGDKFGSPDGIYVAPSGRVWIQTDVSTSALNTGAYAGFGNNQMVCADPVTREVRRFLTGPVRCEITGVFVTPDERTMFVGIQHPGEPNVAEPGGSSSDPRHDPANVNQHSAWPDGMGFRPRSACIVITKDDGGEIGS